ncbi:MAG: hypothetical protein ACOC7S_01815 [Planctomycetota bacterium]
MIVTVVVLLATPATYGATDRASLDYGDRPVLVISGAGIRSEGHPFSGSYMQELLGKYLNRTNVGVKGLLPNPSSAQHDYVVDLKRRDDVGKHIGRALQKSRYAQVDLDINRVLPRQILNPKDPSKEADFLAALVKRWKETYPNGAVIGYGHSEFTRVLSALSETAPMDMVIWNSARQDQGALCDVALQNPDTVFVDLRQHGDLPDDRVSAEMSVWNFLIKDRPDNLITIVADRQHLNSLSTHGDMPNLEDSRPANVYQGDELLGRVDSYSKGLSVVKAMAGKVPSYWTFTGSPGATTEAEVMANFADPGDTVAVAGSGRLADHLAQTAARRVGAQKVVRIPAVLGPDRLQFEAAKQGADLVLGVRENRPEPTELGVSVPWDNRRRRRDYAAAGQPPPPPPPPPPSTDGPWRVSKPNDDDDWQPPQPPPPGGGAISGKPQYSWDRIGGVMLDARAVTDEEFSSGDFSLILRQGRNGLDMRTYRRFVTALWAVYFSEEDPGISIDPIASGIEKHLVRYIGKVVNTDLGRVMREADYLMKKWAVGTGRPDVPGFNDVDDLSFKHGLGVLGAQRRFWFVPEEMRFKRADEMLLFDSARMTLKTEYDVHGMRGEASPADKEFARFFTQHYDEIADGHPVYRELFEYAKMVSLAKYLKQQGVPLLWFLMANKDLVLTEDSPGTVDALARGSDHWRGLRIEGGVNLGSRGDYVYDHSAVQAVSRALARLPKTPAATTSAAGQQPAEPTVSTPFSFDLGQQSFSVLPQHSMTCGKDPRGVRYQTDIALRRNGQPGLELVRYYRPDAGPGGQFGRGWHLLVPYRVEPADDARREFLNAVIPERMTVRNLLSGQEEVLTFSADRYSIAGYVPDEVQSGQWVGLFVMSNASYRLADKLGNEFWFDQAGQMTDMILSENYRLHVDYADDPGGVFAEAPYRVRPAGDQRMDFLNVRIPQRMEVADLANGTTQVLHFGDRDGVAGYVPEPGSQSRYDILAIMSDGSFRLVDNRGNEFALDGAGRFEAVLPACPLVQSISCADQKITFRYTVDPSGTLRVATARAGTGEKDRCLVHYQYGARGALCSTTRELPRDEVACDMEGALKTAQAKGAEPAHRRASPPAQPRSAL